MLFGGIIIDRRNSFNFSRRRKMEGEDNLENGSENHNENGNGRKTTKHHLVPRSRGGAEKLDNIVKIPERYHDAWHRFFGNLTPEEAIRYIQIIFIDKKKPDKWTVEDLYNLQLEIQETA
jgi:hypothetical protein